MRISDWSSDVCSSDLETPVRLDALGLEARAIGIAQPQRRAIVDRRQPAPKLDLALEVQFLRGLICRIDAPAGAQGLEPRLVQRKTRRLPFLAVGHRSEEHTSELQSLMRISYAVF